MPSSVLNTSYPISLLGRPLSISGPPLPSNSRRGPRTKQRWLERIRRAARQRVTRRGYPSPLDQEYAFAVKVRAYVGVSRFPRFDIQNILGQVANALQGAVYRDDCSVFQISGEKFLVLDAEQRTEILVDLIGRW